MKCSYLFFSSILLSLALFALSGPSSAHGGSPDHSEQPSAFSLSLEEIYVITVSTVIIGAAILTKLLKLSDRRLLPNLIFSSIFFLTIDYFFLKYVLYI